MNRKLGNVSILTASVALAVMLTAFGSTVGSAAAAENGDASGRTPTAKRVAQNRELKIREILARQKALQLRVYLNSRGTYVNGKTVSADELSEVVRRAGLEQVVISAESFVLAKRVDGVKEAIKAGGGKNVKVSAPDGLAANSKEAKLREILARQKNDQLKVYINSRHTYVNGKSLAAGELATIVRESGLAEAVITAEDYVAPERVEKAKQIVRDSGIRNIKLATPQAN